MKWISEHIIEILVVIAIILALAVVAYCPARERDAFNKFRDPNTPKATYWDAVFSDLRITSE